MMTGTGSERGEGKDMAVDVEGGAARPAREMALAENADATPKNITLVESPTSLASFPETKAGPGACSKAEEEECRHDVAFSLLGNKANRSETRPPCRSS